MTDAITALTAPPRHHFYGYFNMNPWNAALTHHLALETPFHDRRPGPDDTAQVGLVEVATGRFTPYARTTAFNFQQGSMLRWIDAGYGEEFTHNDWQDGALVARAVNPASGAARTIGGAIEAISPTQPIAIGLNYGRIARCRPVVGYAPRGASGGDTPYPEDDGLFLLDLRTGERRLILSIAAVIAALPMGQTRDGLAYFHHVFFNPSGTRLVFFCRVTRPQGWHSSLWSVNPDGSDLACQIDYRFVVSHLDWWDDRRLVVSTDQVDGQMGFVAFTDGAGDFRRFGAGALPGDGHLCFSPDRRWAVYDTAPRGEPRMSDLFLFDPQTGENIHLGQFHAPEPFSGDIRCDLHPRWRPDGTAITIDSVHEGSRQIYLVDVAAEVRGDRRGRA